MKTLKKLFLFFIAVTLLTGCFKVETTVKINKDGSGKIFQTILMSKTFIDMISQFASSFGDSTSSEEFSLFDEEEFKESAKDFGTGVQYISSEQLSLDGWEGFRLEYQFNDLNKIQLKPGPDDNISVSNRKQVEQEDPEYFFFKYINGEVPEVIISRPQIERDIDDEEKVEGGIKDELNEELLKMTEGMSIDISVEFEGEIVETNATYVEGSKITLVSVDLGEIVKNEDTLEILKNSQPGNLDDLQIFVEKNPGMKLELKKPVSVKFK
jgi:hypothetical protein